MPIEISLKKSTANPTSASGLTLAEPVFNHSNNTLWIGKGSGNSPVWVGAGVCGASGGIAAGLTTQLPTHAAVKNYFDAVSSSFLGATVSYVETFNGATGAVTGVSSFNGLTGAVTGASLGANTFTGLQTLTAGLTTSFAHVSGGLTVGGSLYVNGNLTVSGGVTTSISEVVLIEDNIITLNSNVTGTPTENAGIEIERGTSANTQILWNESTDKWTFTNNGTLYYDIPTDYVSSFNGLTGAVGGVTTSAANTFTALNSFNAGISAAGATLSGTVTAPTPSVGTNNTQVATTAFVQNEIVADTVTTFNGRTGAVQGVSSAAAGTGISISAATGAITITNTGVQTFNGLTGAVTGVTVGGANTFTALNSFAVGISSNGGTFSANTRFLSGIQTDSVLSTTGAGGTVYINSDSNGSGGNSITYIGDWDASNNGTSITVDDQGSTIYLNGSVNNTTSISSPRYSDDYSSIRTYQTTTSATTANQTIATVEGVYDSSQITEVMGLPAFEVTISARDTVLNKTEMLKMLVVQNGTDTVNTQYGLIRTGLTGPVQSYSTTLQNTAGVKDLLIRATPSSANSTKFNVTVRAHNA